MAVFLYYDHFESHPMKVKLYFIWIKLQDFLLLFGVSLFLKGKLRTIGLLASLFYFLRVVWQLFELENYVLANQPYVLDCLFLLLMITILSITFFSEKHTQ